MPDGKGMYSMIEQCQPEQLMDFRHLGNIKNFVEQPDDPDNAGFSGSKETYNLTEENGITRLSVQTEAPESLLDFFESNFPLALEKVKSLAESSVWLTVSTKIHLPVEKIWNCFTNTEDIKQWNNASPDWHTTNAINDLQNGGRFLYRMEAKDGSFGFDFSGTYTNVVQQEFIAYTLDDARQVTIQFIKAPDGILVVEKFEAEEENSYDLQIIGWQAILTNFKHFALKK
jgi:uncharacterized protein YndB with AHSA1/START domain